MQYLLTDALIYEMTINGVGAMLDPRTGFEHKPLANATTF